MKKAKPKKTLAEQGIPRFVLSLTDTQTVVNDQYYSINVAANELDDFNRLIPKAKRTNTARTEMQNLFLHFKQATIAFDEKPHEAERVEGVVKSD